MAFKGLSRKRAFILYTIVTIILLVLSNPAIPYSQAAMWGLVSIWATVCTIGYFMDWRCCFMNNDDNEPLIGNKSIDSMNQNGDNDNDGPSHNIHITTKAEQDEHDRQSQLSVNKPEPKKKKRIYYLDNLKSILTCIVVIHHINCTFSGSGWFYMLANYYNPFIPFAVTIDALNQSYFMCLFFFVSGYFTPISHKKKGRYLFLKDKFKRLGIPLVIFLFILGPITDFMNSYFFILNEDGNPRNQYSYFPDPGPCWFLCWLLIFNSCYCIMDDNIEYYVKDLPVFWKLILYGVVLGIVQFVVIIIVPSYNFLFMPITIGSLPFDIVWFICGTIAKHNNWLKKLTENGSYRYIILAIICGILTMCIFILLFLSDIGNGIMPPKDNDDDNCDDDDSGISVNGAFAGAYFGATIWFGICCVMLSLGWIQFGGLYLDFKNNVTNFFSRSAYTVYIIHPLVVCPVTWTWTKILYQINGVTLIFCDDSNSSKTHFGANYLVWMGWLYTVTVSLIMVWILAHFIRQLPGLNKIL